MIQKDQDEPYLSFAQQRLWFLDQLVPGSVADNLQVVLGFKGNLELTVLKQSITETVQRHEILRTSYHLINGQPTARVEALAVFNFPLIDISNLETEQQSAEFRRLAAIEAQHHFSLARAGLFRPVLLRLKPDDHLLLLTSHRMIGDEESLRIFGREVIALYSGSSLPNHLAQYGNFARQQRDAMQGTVLEGLLTWWKARLEGIVPLELPADRPRPAAQSDRIESLRFEIPPQLISSLKQAGISLETSLLTAFSALLSRISAAQDLVMGVETADPRTPPWAGVIGPMANLLPLRFDLSGGLTFLQLAGRIQGALLDAKSHASLPFEKLLEALPVQRDRSYSPLSQVRFLYSSKIEPISSPAGLSLTSFQVTRREARFDLSLAVETGPEQVWAALDYNPDLFDADRIQRLSAAYLTLLESAAADPDSKLERLKILTNAERALVLETWNDTRSDYRAEECIQHLFEQQARATPAAAALSYRGQILTFEECNRRANQMADYLRGLGVGPEVTVGVCIERSIDMVTTLLGILKAGGAYVPLDPSYPQSRLAFILENSGAQYLVTRTTLLENLPAQNLKVACLEQIQNELERASQENPPHRTTGGNLACVLYTSGSSGIPKGVSSPHSTVINRFTWMWQTYPFESGEVFVQKTALNFVDSIWDIFCPLLQGVPVVILPDETLKDGAQVVKTLSEEKVSRIVLVPSLLRSLMDTGPDLAEKLPFLRYCITSGEAISLELYQRFRSALPRAILINLYGTSEVADATWYDSAWERPFLRVPIGRPISNARIYILDEQLQPAPIGVPGELFVAGEGVVRGYLNRPDLTAEKFLPDPYGGIPGARMYRTGDLACWMSDGNLDYLGRIDFQVKIRGLRVELSEIEASLRQHPSVLAVVAMAREAGSDEKYLAAYVVARTGQKPSVSELRVFLGKRLPNYMIPAKFVFLESMPLTPNGKVNRLALPSPDENRPEIEQDFVAPGSLTEEALAEIWRDLLHLKRVGVQDNFFELGGDSLTAMRLASRIQERMQLEIPLRIFFESPIIADLALVIDDMLLQELENLSEEEV